MRGFDFVEQLFPRKYEPLPVGVVAIDDKSLAQYGQWPWSRALVAKLVDKIAAGKPGVLGVDIIFAEPDRLSPGRLVDSDPEIPAPVAGELAKLPTHEAALAEALRKVPTVLAVSAGGQARAHAERAPSRVTMVLESGANPDQFLLTYPDLLGSLPEIAAAESGQGAVDQGPDRDGITRSVPLFVFAGGNLVPDLALEMLRVATGARAVGIVAGANGVKGATLGSFFFPSDRNGRVYPYFMPFYDARFISAADLLDGSYDSGRLQGTAVLLGSSATGLADLSQTPLGLMPGVEVWAQTLESMMTGNLLRRPGFLWRVEMTIILVAGLIVIFALPYQNPRIAGTTLLVIVAILLGSAIASFEFSKLLLDGVYPALSSALVFGVMLSENLRVAEAGRRRLAAELQHEREREARTDGELNAARSIQIGLLPRHFPGPPDRSDVDVFASIEPARMVGGDLYDFVLLDSGRLSFAIADVSGKGVPAALFMAMTKEVLHTATLRYRNALDRVFIEANAKISAASEELARRRRGHDVRDRLRGHPRPHFRSAHLRERRARRADHDARRMRAGGTRTRGRTAARHGRRLSVLDRTTAARARRGVARLHRRRHRGAGQESRAIFRRAAESIAGVGADYQARRPSSISCATMSTALLRAPSRLTTSRCSRCAGWCRKILG